MKKELEIRLSAWDSKCTDGCCYDAGVKLFLNGEQLERSDNIEGSDYIGEQVDEALIAVLTKLGYKVNISYGEEDL